MNYYSNTTGYLTWEQWTRRLLRQTQSSKPVLVINRITNQIEDAHINNAPILESEMIDIAELVRLEDGMEDTDE
jgi:hypothetical protein